MDALDDLAENADSPDDRAIIFLAGRGAAHDGYRNQVGYFVSADGKSDKPASLMRWQDMIDRGGQIPAKHILFIFDACFSGLAFTRAVYPKTKSFLSQVLQRRSRQVIAAGPVAGVVAAPPREGAIVASITAEYLSVLTQQRVRLDNLRDLLAIRNPMCAEQLRQPPQHFRQVVFGQRFSSTA